MSRTLAVSGRLPFRYYAEEPEPLAIGLYPCMATAEQIALVLENVRSWGSPMDEESDQEIVAHHQNSTSLPDVWVPGGWPYEGQDDGGPLDQAWIAMLTPRA